MEEQREIMVRLTDDTLNMLQEMGHDLSRVDWAGVIEGAVSSAYALQPPRPQTPTPNLPNLGRN